MSTTADRSVYDANTVQSLRSVHMSIPAFVFTVLLLLLASKAASYRRGLQAVNHLPGLRVPFHPTLSLPGVVFPTTWWNPGINFLWHWRHKVYTQFGNDTISIVPFLLGPPTIYTGNLDVIHQLLASNSSKSFHKPDASVQLFLQWGMNLLIADRDVWRKHRRIMGPAFNSKLYESVWVETLKTYCEMVSEEGWISKDRVNVSAVQTLSTKFALLIIGKCGFGFSFGWSDPPRTADGRMTVQQALRIAADTFAISTFAPLWMRKLPVKIFKEAWEARQELMKFMQESVADRKAGINARGSVELDRDRDAFSMLVAASECEDDKLKLDDSELIGNVFIMLFAGHETTARSIAITIALLSVHDDLQEEIYEHIISVIGFERDPVYDDYTTLNKVLAAFFESLRMFPPAYIMLREASEDTILQISKPKGEEGVMSLPISKGTQIVLDLIGAHYNHRQFDDPEEYRPSRWYGTSNDSETFYAFSVGPRTCIGRKFATTEVVCFFTMLLRDYKVEPILDKGETKEQWRERILCANLEVTLGVRDVPVTFIRRNLSGDY
ncbi:hypothetical protein HYPSUDRAFT_42029 [Hypholoma sublateritium FD-334 SS-4]|uniref:Cytochrome P450 n=1 Tax=Hypholoma sublateritium (strain FD-334 SS-4) TaxID=945553 RepID=A0A0D2MCZ9_HYPSF|nr:hypothetical protein HYPSUDRAFT_42029 [Hypholoma sublateritium FD-334 SS-4]